MKRVFIISSYPVLGAGVASLLNRQVEVVGQETDLEEAIVRIKGLHPDVVIVDSDVTEMSLRSVVRALWERVDVRVIGLSLWENKITIYRKEQRTVRDVDDLLDAINS